MKKRFKSAARWLLAIMLIMAGFSVLMVIVYRFFDPPVTPLMIRRSISGEAIRAERRWVSFESIPQSLIDAVVASEDGKFPHHIGFDFGEMRAAYQRNKDGKRIRGASTITQQMCKNVFLWERRSYTRKAFEMWFTVWVELLWSKQRIMEVYLNVIEMGKGIYGIGAAVPYYYHHPVAHTSRREAAMIAAILPSPRKRNPVNPDSYTLQRRQQILSLMDKTGKVSLPPSGIFQRTKREKSKP
ncbi:MAG: monofunctional biosynthetic peptidoglycan transglycosylase [Bacteroidales bacterium]|nr:monofunctional biosynthetic peptidoglycan transglycosylase [Bacteroidales bacterium]